MNFRTSKHIVKNDKSYSARTDQRGRKVILLDRVPGIILSGFVEPNVPDRAHFASEAPLLASLYPFGNFLALRTILAKVPERVHFH